MNNIEKLQMLEWGIYRISLALVAICEQECCNYGFDDEVMMADEYVKCYEKEHTNE